MARLVQPRIEFGPFGLAQIAFGQANAPHRGGLAGRVLCGQVRHCPVILAHGTSFISFIRWAMARATFLFTARVEMPYASAIRSCAKLERKSTRLNSSH